MAPTNVAARMCWNMWFPPRARRLAGSCGSIGDLGRKLTPVGAAAKTAHHLSESRQSGMLLRADPASIRVDEGRWCLRCLSGAHALAPEGEKPGADDDDAAGDGRGRHDLVEDHHPPGHREDGLEIGEGL